MTTTVTHMSAPMTTPGESPTANKKKPSREQKFAPSSHLYMQGRLCNVYLNWDGRTNLIVIPHQRVFKLTEFYPLDLGYLFQEIYGIMEQKRVQNFTLNVFKRDWNVAPHLFIRVGMHQEMYNLFLTSPHMTAGYATPGKPLMPSPPSPPAPPPPPAGGPPPSPHGTSSNTEFEIM